MVEKPYLQTSLRQGTARCGYVGLVNQQPSRKGANGALGNAYVLIGDKVKNACVLQNSLGEADHDRIIAAQHFEHDPGLLPPPNRASTSVAGTGLDCPGRRPIILAKPVLGRR